jgi:hypothetical protein
MVKGAALILILEAKHLTAFECSLKCRSSPLTRFTREKLLAATTYQRITTHFETPANGCVDLKENAMLVQF